MPESIDQTLVRAVAQEEREKISCRDIVGVDSTAQCSMQSKKLNQKNENKVCLKENSCDRSTS